MIFGGVRNSGNGSGETLIIGKWIWDESCVLTYARETIGVIFLKKIIIY